MTYPASKGAPTHATTRQFAKLAVGEGELMNMRPHYALAAALLAGLAVGASSLRIYGLKARHQPTWWPKWQFTMLMPSPGITLPG